MLLCQMLQQAWIVSPLAQAFLKDPPRFPQTPGVGECGDCGSVCVEEAVGKPLALTPRRRLKRRVYP